MDVEWTVRLHTLQRHEHTKRQTDETPAESVDHVNILAEGALKTTAWRHNQRDR